MKALLLKDFYVIIKQMKVFLVLIVLFAFLPGTSMTVFAIVYAALLPFTALAYDDRAKWDTYARMLPYPETSAVMSKYVLGYLLMAGSVPVAILGGVFKMLVFKDGTNFNEEALQIGLGVLCGLLFLAIELPFVYRFGVEKGRLVFIGLCAILGGVAGAYFAVNDGSLHFPAMSESLFIVIACVAVAALQALSVFLSIRFYKAQKK